jgi:hypothetical protein
VRGPVIWPTPHIHTYRCDHVEYSTEIVITISHTTDIMIMDFAIPSRRLRIIFSRIQRSLSRIRVPWDSRPYFTVSDLRLPFSSPPTTRKVTVEVFDPASTRVELDCQSHSVHYYLYSLEADPKKTLPFPSNGLLLLPRMRVYRSVT